MRRELEQIEIPDEHGARERAWSLVRAVFDERQPAARRPRMLRPALAIAAVAAVLAAVLSPPGRAVLDGIREAVGVERAQPALFSLPAEGKLLVASDAGVWVVNQDGSKRLLGPYREASWSPFGRYIVAAGENELAALEPDGDVRWTLARPSVTSPRWAGTETDTRIAYVDGTGLRLVAGDGSDDRLLVPGFHGELAWKPGGGFALAYTSPREVRVRDISSGRLLWHRPVRRATSVQWSADGRSLLVGSRTSLMVYDARGDVRYELGGAAPTQTAALAPDAKQLTFAADVGTRVQLWVVPRIRPDASAARRLFSGTGAFDRLLWTPDGRWILVSWPAADQWLFIRANGAGLRAVANVSEQFRSRTFPQIEGWCCGP